MCPGCASKVLPGLPALLSQELTVVVTRQCIYGRPGGPVFTKHAFAAVLHHQQSPEFYDEVRHAAPNILTRALISAVTECLHMPSFLSIRLSCQLSSTRSTIYSSPSTTSAVTVTARPAPKRGTLLRLKVAH